MIMIENAYDILKLKIIIISCIYKSDVSLLNRTILITPIEEHHKPKVTISRLQWARTLACRSLTKRDSTYCTVVVRICLMFICQLSTKIINTILDLGILTSAKTIVENVRSVFISIAKTYSLLEIHVP